MLDRVAAAPISWGICEVPGWGIQLSVERVLSEMAELGIHATELGAIGWLPTDPAAIRDTLDRHGLRLTGGFVPLVLHDAALIAASRQAAADAARMMSAAGATHFVTAVVSDPDEWRRPHLDDADWEMLLTHLVEIADIVAGFGMTQVVHPHVDTLIETAAEMQRFLDGCSLPFCLDTGHLLIGGADPVAIAKEHTDRVGLVHLKDVSMPIAQRLRDAELTLMTATQAGLFPALGSGDAPIEAVVNVMESHHYEGWYVIEQDVALSGGDEPPAGEGPLLGMSQSLAFIRHLAAGHRLGAGR